MRSFAILCSVILSLGVFVGPARADVSVERKPWYELPTNIRPTTLKAAIAADKDFLGANHPGWKHVANAPGLKNICAALSVVHLTCDYNTRVTVSLFLTVNGKGLFPASGGTNPYCTPADRTIEKRIGFDLPDDCFIGHPPQNDMLAAAIWRNIQLFKEGDLMVDTLKGWG